jgi:hypothetical protein
MYSKNTMKRTINIFWSCLEPEWMRAEEPAAVLPEFIRNDKMLESRIPLCPAFRNELHNVFGVKSIYDYEFSVNPETREVSTAIYDQKFYNRHVIVRSMKERIFSFSQEMIFFTDESSLIMSGDLFPYLEDNNITERCIVYPGQFDIGRWYRPVEFAFKLKDRYNTFKIEAGEIYQYVRFHTDNNIKFIQFRDTPKLNEMLKSITETRSNKKGIFSLDYYYERFKLKKLIMKEIKENLL